jgi:hypothetical protein
MRNSLIWAATLLTAVTITHPNSGEGFCTAAPLPHPAASAAQSQKTVTVPAGTRILIRTVDSIDSSKQKAGFRFTATLETNLQAQGTVVAPRGTKVYGRLAQASSAGNMSGGAQLTLELTDIVIRCSPAPMTSRAKDKDQKRQRGLSAGQGWVHSSAVLRGEERELPLAQAPALSLGQPCPVPRRASRWSSRVNL